VDADDICSSIDYDADVEAEEGDAEDTAAESSLYEYQYDADDEA
jgi:hypothetical protein